MSLKAIIVDDERRARELLQFLLQKYCPNVAVVDLCESVSEAAEKITLHNPDLVFLDVEMKESGFTLINKTAKPLFEVIFTTAHSKYALDAFKINASGYLTKPVEPELLIKAVAKVSEQIEARKINAASPILKSGQDRIGVPSISGINFIAIDDIVRCQASSNYTDIFLRTGEKIIASRTLKEFEDVLEIHQFLRIHKSHVVNLKCISSYLRSGKPSLKLLDGSILPVGEKMKSVLESHLHII